MELPQLQNLNNFFSCVHAQKYNAVLFYLLNVLLRPLFTNETQSDNNKHLCETCVQICRRPKSPKVCSKNKYKLTPVSIWKMLKKTSIVLIINLFFPCTSVPSVYCLCYFTNISIESSWALQCITTTRRSFVRCGAKYN